MCLGLLAGLGTIDRAILNGRILWGYSVMSTTWVGFRFFKDPGFDWEYQAHKFWAALKDAKIVAYEIDNLVFAECKGADGRGNDDEVLGDIVPITEIFHRTVNHLGGRVRAHGIRLDDEQVAELERHASTGQGKVDFDQVHARVRSEEGQERLLREREQET